MTAFSFPDIQTTVLKQMWMMSSARYLLFGGLTEMLHSFNRQSAILTVCWQSLSIDSVNSSSVTNQEERSTVIVLLQELVLALRCLVSDELWIQFLLLAAFFFRHMMKSLKLLLLFLNPTTHHTSMSQQCNSTCFYSKILCLYPGNWIKFTQNYF